MKFEHTRHKKFIFSPQDAALLVIDVQDYFTDKRSHAFIPASAEIIPKIKELTEAFHAADRPVIFTRHLDTEPGNMMDRWWGEMIEEKDPLSELNRELDTDLGITIIKHSYDSFMGTDLEQILKERNVKQVVITGVVTHLCCETTARAAFMRNFEVFFVTDCTAAKDPKHHEAAIFNLAYGFAVPIECDTIVRWLG